MAAPAPRPAAWQRLTCGPRGRPLARSPSRLPLAAELNPPGAHWRRRTRRIQTAGGGAMEAAQLRCTAAVEEPLPGGCGPRRRVLRNATVLLGRNELRQPVLRVVGGSGAAAAVLSFALSGDAVRLFTRFAGEGRAAVRVGPGGAQVLLSDCPPDALRRFLRLLRLKVTAGSRGPARPPRLLERPPASFAVISPVQERDLLHNPVPRRGCGEGRGERPAEVPRAERRPPARLSAEQEAVLGAVRSGKSIFFTGCAGTGKSFLLKRIVGSLPPNVTYATASTGVAACHIGGTTLHAFAALLSSALPGIGSGKAPLEQCIQLAERPGVRQHWLACQHLIIDEISMVDGKFFDRLEAVARAVRKRDEPFGGIQLIICGDFLQLPPVCKPNEETKFCFQAKSWRKCIHINMELTEVRRQTDKTFVSLLSAIRLGRCTEEVTRQLMQTATNRSERDGILATRLCTHKDDVEITNERRLQQLSGEVHTFEALDSDPMLVKLIDAQCPVGGRVELKLGAQVMLAKNLDVSQGLVNGARGIVVGFESEEKGLPKVRFLCGVTQVIRMEKWVFKGPSGVHLSRQQLPLKLAWAISIHKSQGMSLDCVEISLSRVFESGQAYVALSRARSLAGLRVLDFDPKVVRADPSVLQFYRQLRRHQLLTQDSLHTSSDADEKENVKGS
ncbi:ATP-dependent DNA helicase PIF1 isoform X2 [Chiroxiphia lanceolata]|uniref:ATP-dependent DNA helicase PIF1 isoform X2 n=1 Tax=Chiroxiphia lanceolata TaxID=296741 RepID=UPI0013CEA74D|nr:ATP-dependent DNA helicase PIF1 isoform X2 [Chiroxiphia lanceolata]